MKRIRFKDVRNLYVWERAVYGGCFVDAELNNRCRGKGFNVDITEGEEWLYVHEIKGEEKLCITSHSDFRVRENEWDKEGNFINKEIVWG